MPRNPKRYPNTPEGVAQREHDMTKNCQPVGLAQHKSSKLFTKEQFLKDAKNQMKESSNNKPERPKKFRGNRGDGLTTANNLKNLSHALIQYSLQEDSLDVHGFLRSLELTPQTLLEMSKKDPEVGNAYERAKSNFAYNNLIFLRRALNATALSKSAELHSHYSEFLKEEKRKEKKIDKSIAIEALHEFQEAKKEESAKIPETKIAVRLIY